jgi:hypothetical protein
MPADLTRQQQPRNILSSFGNSPSAVTSVTASDILVLIVSGTSMTRLFFPRFYPLYLYRYLRVEQVFMIVDKDHPLRYRYHIPSKKVSCITPLGNCPVGMVPPLIKFSSRLILAL